MDNDPFTDDFPSYKLPFIMDFPVCYLSHNQAGYLLLKG